MDVSMTPATAAPPADGPTLDVYKRLFQEGRDLTQTARTMAAKHRRYYDGKIDDKLERQLRAKKQPTFVINRVRPGVEGVVGIVERGKSDPQAFPRTPKDQDSSEVATDSLRYISDQNRWPRLKLDAFRNIVVEGTAAVLTEVDSQLEVKFRRIRHEEYFYDPYARELDLSDKSYDGIAKWQYIDEIVAAYPDKEAALRTACQNGDTGDSSWSDRPEQNGSTWADPKRKRMLIVEMYKRHQGTWWKCVFVGDLKLEEGPSPYLDNDDKPCNPIEAYSAFIDDENNRYGPVADMIGPQDEINVYRRKAAHRATYRQVQESDTIAAYADPEEVRREAARADGVLPAGYQIVPNDGFSMDMALFTEAKAEIERSAPNPALLARGNASSGRQDLIRQQAGLTELAHLFAGLDDLEQRVWRQAWARVRQFWTEPKFIRVTDDDKAVRFIQINEPQWGAPAPVMDPQTGMPKVDPVTRQIVMAPQFLGMKNAVAQMGVDIVVDSTPDTANVQQEQYQALVELAKVGALGPNPGPILLQASQLPKKRELMEQLEKMQTQQQPDPAAQAKTALIGAQVDKTQAEAQRARADAASKMRDAPAENDPTGGAKAMMDLRATQAGIDKTFAQADEARARAAKTAAEAHQTVFSTIQPQDPTAGV